MSPATAGNKLYCETTEKQIIRDRNNEDNKSLDVWEIMMGVGTPVT